MQRAARAATVLAVGELVGKVATLGLLVYAVRALTPLDFGAFNYALAFGAMLAVLPSWGLDALLIQQVGADTSRLPGQYAQLLLLRTVLAVPVVIVGVTIGMVERPTAQARYAIVALLVAAVLESYAHAPRAAAGVMRAQASTAVILALQRIVTAVAGVLSLLFGTGLVGLSTAYLGATLAGTTALFLWIRRAGVRPAWRAVGARELARTARRSVPLGIDALVAMALFRLDVLILGWIHGDTMVAEYSAPKRLVETVLFVAWAVARVAYPAMAAARDDVRRCLHALRAGVSATAFFFVPFAALMITLGGGILELLFGGYYADRGTAELSVLSVTPFFFAIGYLYSYAFVARGQSAVALTTSVVAVVLHLALNLLLIPVWGAMGAAVATSGAYLVEAALLVVVAGRRLGGLRQPAPLLLPLACSVPAALVASVLPLDVVLATLVFGAVYLALWLPTAYRWQPQEVSVLRSVISVRRGR